MNGVVEEIEITIVIVSQDMVPSVLALIHLDRTVNVRLCIISMELLCIVYINKILEYMSDDRLLRIPQQLNFF